MTRAIVGPITPPHAIEAEQCVLGSLLLDNDALDRIADRLADTDFYRGDHRLVFRAVRSLVGKGLPADAITVAELLERHGKSEECGGLAYLGELAANTPSAANILRYAEIVREKSVLRALAAIGNDIVAAALAPQGREAKELLDEAEQKVFAIAERGLRQQGGFAHIQPLLVEVVGRVQALHDRHNPSDITGTPSGYVDLDRLTSGLQPAELLIIAGRPSMGKTALALNIAEHVALEARLPVAVFSMEMSGAQLALRLLSARGRIDAHRVRTGRLRDDEWGRLAQAMGELHEAPIHIDENGSLTPGELRARARRLHRQCGQLGLIVVDYLQLMSVSGRGENRATEISEISRALKALAKELHVPVIALSQLNRSLEQRPNKRPMMSDLRESGAIEQDADTILFIYRDEVYNPETQDRGTAEVIIGKQRNGPVGTVRLTFLGEYTRFENAA